MKILTKIKEKILWLNSPISILDGVYKGKYVAYIYEGHGTKLKASDNNTNLLLSNRGVAYTKKTTAKPQSGFGPEKEVTIVVLVYAKIRKYIHYKNKFKALLGVPI